MENTKSIIEQANAYYYGEGQELNLEEAFKLYEKVAELGDADAQCLAGYCLRKGIGTDKDEQKAFELFVQSAGKDFPMGVFNLAYCYEKGVGCEANTELAKEYYEKAKELGYTE